MSINKAVFLCDVCKKQTIIPKATCYQAGGASYYTCHNKDTLKEENKAYEMCLNCRKEIDSTIKNIQDSIKFTEEQVKKWEKGEYE